MTLRFSSKSYTSQICHTLFKATQSILEYRFSLKVLYFLILTVTTEPTSQMSYDSLMEWTVSNTNIRILSTQILLQSPILALTVHHNQYRSYHLIKTQILPQSPILTMINNKNKTSSLCQYDSRFSLKVLYSVVCHPLSITSKSLLRVSDSPSKSYTLSTGPTHSIQDIEPTKYQILPSKSYTYCHNKL
jgi:hypothetical protein